MSESNIETSIETENRELVPLVKQGRPRKEQPEKPLRPRGRPKKEKPEEENAEIKPLVKRGRPIKEKLPKEPKPRKPRTLKEVSLWRDNPREYFRNYYHNRPKVECICPHCYNKFNSKVRLYDHVRRSTQCRKIREIRESVKQPENLNNLD